MDALKSMYLIDKNNFFLNVCASGRGIVGDKGTVAVKSLMSWKEEENPPTTTTTKSTATITTTTTTGTRRTPNTKTKNDRKARLF